MLYSACLYVHEDTYALNRALQRRRALQVSSTPYRQPRESALVKTSHLLLFRCSLFLELLGQQRTVTLLCQPTQVRPDGPSLCFLGLLLHTLQGSCACVRVCIQTGHQQARECVVRPTHMKQRMGSARRQCQEGGASDMSNIRSHRSPAQAPGELGPGDAPRL